MALLAFGACSATPAILPPDAVLAVTDAGSTPDAGVDRLCEPSEPSAVYGGLVVDFVSAGLRGIGAACAFGPQCASGLCSGSATTGACGVCLERRRLGESCNNPAQGCGPSATCRGGICQTTKKSLGETCAVQPKGGDLFECDDELFCLAPSGGMGDGVCTQRVALGAVCATQTFPQTVCVAGAVCQGGICAKLGADSCAERACPSGSYCQYDAVAAPTCLPGALPPGSRCGVVDGIGVPGDCAAGTVCGSHEWPNGGGGPATVATCLTLPSEGEICIHDTCAAGLFCATRSLDCSGATSERRCQRMAREGESCETASYGRDRSVIYSTCASGLECRGGRCKQPCG